jgi:hypothetical protein
LNRNLSELRESASKYRKISEDEKHVQRYVIGKVTKCSKQTDSITVVRKWMNKTPKLARSPKKAAPI